MLFVTVLLTNDVDDDTVSVDGAGDNGDDYDDNDDYDDHNVKMA